MGESTGSLALPLRVPQTKRPESGSLRLALLQMNSQRGSFRNVTEASLQAEIATEKQGNRDVEMQDIDQEGDEGTVEDRNRRAQQAREEMLNLSK